jgi:hypothetical protein
MAALAHLRLVAAFRRIAGGSALRHRLRGRERGREHGSEKDWLRHRFRPRGAPKAGADFDPHIELRGKNFVILEASARLGQTRALSVPGTSSCP